MPKVVQYGLPEDLFEDKRVLGVRVSEFFISLFISIMFFASFLTFYFFVITTRVEDKIVKDNINRVTKSFFSDINSVMDPISQQVFQTALQQVEAPDLSKQDKLVNDKNNETTQKAVQLVLLLVFSSGIVIVIIWTIMRARARIAKPKGELVPGVDYPDLVHLLVENAILLGFVAASELLFLFAIAAHHRSLDEGKLRIKIIQTIRNFINN